MTFSVRVSQVVASHLRVFSGSGGQAKSGAF